MLSPLQTSFATPIRLALTGTASCEEVLSPGRQRDSEMALRLASKKDAVVLDQAGYEVRCALANYARNNTIIPFETYTALSAHVFLSLLSKRCRTLQAFRVEKFGSSSVFEDQNTCGSLGSAGPASSPDEEAEDHPINDEDLGEPDSKPSLSVYLLIPRLRSDTVSSRAR